MLTFLFNHTKTMVAIAEIKSILQIFSITLEVILAKEKGPIIKK